MATAHTEIGMRSRRVEVNLTDDWSPGHEDPLDAFERERGALLAIAKRILGSARAAEDVRPAARQGDVDGFAGVLARDAATYSCAQKHV